MYIIGRNPVLEALKSAQKPTKIFILFGSHGPAIQRIRQLAKIDRIPVIELSRQKFVRLAPGSSAQGVAALIEDVPILQLDELIASLPLHEPAFLLACDGITDPHNLGALIRTAESAGVHGVIVPARNSAPITETVIKTSAGAAHHIAVARVGNLAQCLAKLKDAGIWIIGTDSDGDADLFRFDGNRDVCLVVGSEGKGMRPVVRKACDVVLRIPQFGKINSLNASVAGALAMYEIRRSRME